MFQTALFVLMLGQVVNGGPNQNNNSPQPNPPNGPTPSVALQREMVAQLHAYIGNYRKLGAGPPLNSNPTQPSLKPPPSSSTPVTIDPSKGAKEIKIFDVLLDHSDNQYLYVTFKVRIREIQMTAVIYTLEGMAQGKFRLGEVLPEKLSLYPIPGTHFSDLTLIKMDVPRISGPGESDWAKRALRGNFPDGIWVPLYPTLTVKDTHAEEMIKPPAKPVRPNVMEFHIKMSNLSARTVSFHLQTVDGSAKTGIDYVGANGNPSITTLQAEYVLRIPLKRRDGMQGDRTFTLNITNILNAHPASFHAKGLIIDYPGENAP